MKRCLASARFKFRGEGGSPYRAVVLAQRWENMIDDRTVSRALSYPQRERKAAIGSVTAFVFLVVSLISVTFTLVFALGGLGRLRRRLLLGCGRGGLLVAPRLGRLLL